MARTKKVRQQQSLFADRMVQFPTTRYQGSKAKLCSWIWDEISHLEFSTCLDAFGGTGSIAYLLKQKGKAVTYNDVLRFNHLFGLALVENKDTRLSSSEIDSILTAQDGVAYPTFVYDTFPDIYYTDDENRWIDQTITIIASIDDPKKRALAFFALAQACIIKRPYNLFHRKNLYVRQADVKRSFGNKTTWDKPFEHWFRVFIDEANRAVFDNGKENRALQLDALDIPGEYDLVYIDTPYIAGSGVGVDYKSFYHFLEGMTDYGEWPEHIDYKSKHRRLIPQKTVWTDKKRIHAAFDELFKRFRKSILVVSYRSDGIPSEEELIELLSRYKSNVQIRHYGQYKYVLSKNSKSKELLLIGT